MMDEFMQFALYYALVFATLYSLTFLIGSFAYALLDNNHQALDASQFCQCKGYVTGSNYDNGIAKCIAENNSAYLFRMDEKKIVVCNGVR